MSFLFSIVYSFVIRKHMKNSYKELDFVEYIILYYIYIHILFIFIILNHYFKFLFWNVHCVHYFFLLLTFCKRLYSYLANFESYEA